MCGVLGLFLQEPDRARTEKEWTRITATFFDLFAGIQGRGQDACGVAISDRLFSRYKGLGQISQVFTPEKIEEIRNSHSWGMIGHTRYPTAGDNSKFNAQPHYLSFWEGDFALVSNGDIPEYQKYRKKLEDKGASFYSNNDAELLLRFIIYQIAQNGLSIERAIEEVIFNIKGAYSAIFLTKNAAYVFRDKWEVRPLTLFKWEEFIVVSSETAVVPNFLDIPQESRWDIPGGSICIIHRDGTIEQRDSVQKGRCHHCIFENIYFAHPTSCMWGSEKENACFRGLLGKKWAEEFLSEEEDFIKTRFDCVSEVPTSGRHFAQGIYTKLEIPHISIIERNLNISRTFISSKKQGRYNLASKKYRILRTMFQNKEFNPLIADDSVVRGTTLNYLIQEIKKAGANFVGVASSCPPVWWGCKLGIDLPTRQELIAYNRTIEQIREYLGLEYLKYLSLEGLKNVMGEFGNNPDDFCYGCLTGDYGPFEIAFDE